ncbi:MAG: nuclear transport factor 2 family protein [Chloroflexi bacterium]|nr:nuclear transport factor 2 family protein [Chloroflexota bacterium]
MGAFEDTTALSRAYEAFQAKDLTTLDRLFADDVRFRLEPGFWLGESGEATTKAELFAEFQGLLERWPRPHLLIHDVTASDRHMVGVFSSFPDGPDGEELLSTHICHVKAGQLHRIWQANLNSARLLARWREKS